MTLSTDFAQVGLRFGSSCLLLEATFIAEGKSVPRLEIAHRGARLAPMGKDVRCRSWIGWAM